MKLVFGCDHCGFEAKEEIKEMLKNEYEIIDVGCYSKDTVDFPDVAKNLCAAILEGRAERGIMFCSTGIGAAIACNKVKGIRAGLCHDTYCAHQGVEHDNIQVMAIGAEVIGRHLIREVVKTFLKAEFHGEEEFQIRLNKLEEMEK